jgi:hypothetical protein
MMEEIRCAFPLAFVGGGGGGGILLLLGWLFLVLLAIALLSGAIVLAYLKKPKLAVLTLLLSLWIGSNPYWAYLDFKDRVEFRAERKRDFDVKAVLFSADGYRLTLDGRSDLRDRVQLSGTITFEIDFSDSRMLSGTCSGFDLKTENGEFDSIILSDIEISEEMRAEFLSSFPPVAGQMHFNRQTENYFASFRKHSHTYETFRCSRRPERKGVRSDP